MWRAAAAELVEADAELVEAGGRTIFVVVGSRSTNRIEAHPPLRTSTSTNFSRGISPQSVGPFLPFFPPFLPPFFGMAAVRASNSQKPAKAASVARSLRVPAASSPGLACCSPLSGA